MPPLQVSPSLQVLTQYFKMSFSSLKFTLFCDLLFLLNNLQFLSFKSQFMSFESQFLSFKSLNGKFGWLDHFENMTTYKLGETLEGI